MAITIVALLPEQPAAERRGVGAGQAIDWLGSFGRPGLAPEALQTSAFRFRRDIIDRGELQLVVAADSATVGLDPVPVFGNPASRLHQLPFPLSLPPLPLRDPLLRRQARRDATPLDRTAVTPLGALDRLIKLVQKARIGLVREDGAEPVRLVREGVRGRDDEGRGEVDLVPAAADDGLDRGRPDHFAHAGPAERRGALEIGGQRREDRRQGRNQPKTEEGRGACASCGLRVELSGIAGLTIGQGSPVVSEAACKDNQSARIDFRQGRGAASNAHMEKSRQALRISGGDRPLSVNTSVQRFRPLISPWRLGSEPRQQYLSAVTVHSAAERGNQTHCP